MLCTHPPPPWKAPTRPVLARRIKVSESTRRSGSGGGGGGAAASSSVCGQWRRCVFGVCWVWSGVSLECVESKKDGVVKMRVVDRWVVNLESE